LTFRTPVRMAEFCCELFDLAVRGDGQPLCNSAVCQNCL